MKASRGQFSVLLDEGAPVMVATPFESRGHRVIRHGDVLESGSTDDQVRWRRLSPMPFSWQSTVTCGCWSGDTPRPNRLERFKRLHLIFVGCKETLAPHRLEQAMTLIEHEWTIACDKAARRMWISIEAHQMVSHR